MPAFRGKTLWFSALALWLTAASADSVEAAVSDDKAWAYDVVHAHVQQTKSWAKTDYRLIEGPSGPDHFAITVWHKDDIELTRNGIAAGGKSFYVHLSRSTQRIVDERHFQ